MKIDDIKLIRGLIKNVEQLSAFAKDADGPAIIKSSQAILLELNRRADFEEENTYYQRGRALIVEASSLQKSDSQEADELNRVIDKLPALLPSNLNSLAATEYIDKIRQCIWALFDGSNYPFIDNMPLKALLARMIEWEQMGYKLPAANMPAVNESDRLVTVDAALLERYMRANRPGYENTKVVECTPIPGGFSKQTVLFDVGKNGKIERLVYRGTTKIQVISDVLVDIAQEFNAVSYAYSKGATVAEPLWLQSDIGATGTRFFISRRAPGTNLGTAIAAHKDISAAATKSLAEALAKIHCLPLDPANELLKKSELLPPNQNMSLTDVVRLRVGNWSKFWKSLNWTPQPIMDFAFQWLYDNASESDDEPVFVHGDYGLHNILVHEDRVSAVLDWEACFVGDRALDISQLFSGTTDKMDRELFMKTYIAAGGKPVSQFRLKYYQALMAAQFMLSTIDAQHIYQHRAAAGTNYCTLGLGFIHHTAITVMNGIMEASAAKQATIQ